MCTCPTIYVMVGLPYSGKSTYVRNHLMGLIVVDTDSYIEKKSVEFGKTYNEIFKETITEAYTSMNEKVKELVGNRLSFVVDQTNLTCSSRAKWLSLAKEHSYRIVAIVFKEIDSDTLKSRIEERKNKIIPNNVLQSMKERYTIPTKNEGFDEIVFH